MNWQEIKPSFEASHFLHGGKPIWSERFAAVMSFHAPGVAPVKDASGWYHIDAEGCPLYKARYHKAYGFYCDRAAVKDKTGWSHIDLNGDACYPSATRGAAISKRIAAL